MTTKYKIHPAIGIARVGNSPEYYLAPEQSGGLPLDPANGQPVYSGPGVPPQAVFRDAAGALKKQAARFRVFAYDDADPTDLGTPVRAGAALPTGGTLAGIEWTVHLANKKASWFQFQQLTGSGQEGDAGYEANNAQGRGRPQLNPLRFNMSLGSTPNPATIADPSRMALILDPGPRTVSGPAAAPQEFGLPPRAMQPFAISTLGRILTDAASNLMVLGGEGHSGSTDGTPVLTHYANNNGWFDDTADGPVTAQLTLDDGSAVSVDVPAWVLCGPPAYAPEVLNIVTLYDTLFDVFVRQFGLAPDIFSNGAFQSGYQPRLDGEIHPMLARPERYRFTADIPGFGNSGHHSSATATAQQFAARILPVIRHPADTSAAGQMPELAGDNPLSQRTESKYLTITQTQYFFLNQYAAGKASAAPPPAVGAGVALDRAYLEGCVGGAFCPGIEMTWICRNPTLYQPLPANPAPSDAFRFRHKDVSGGLTLTNGADNDYSGGMEPGDATKYMAQPWQADFNECTAQPIDQANVWWWPAQRPFVIHASSRGGAPLPWTRHSDTNSDQFADLQMVSNWKDLGFVLDIGAGAADLQEIERNQQAITDYQPPAPLGELIAAAEPPVTPPQTTEG